MWSDSRHYQLGGLFSCHSLTVTVSIVCVETDFGSGLMGSQPNQTSAADSYPLWTVLSIICEQELSSYQRFFWLFVGILCLSWNGENAVLSLQHVLCILSLCVCALIICGGLVLPVLWLGFLFCLSLLCASLTQFCDEWGLIFWLPFSPRHSMNETFGHVENSFIWALIIFSRVDLDDDNNLLKMK